jgi:manganese-dependent ADP-ribose/CDP-alcohol diphosphatase
MSSETPDKPLVVFGILTDVQYANCENGASHGVPRYYRNSLELVRNAVRAWKAYEESNNQELKFVIQLGDLLDGKTAKIEEPLDALDRVLACFEHFHSPNDGQTRLLHIWGNHEFYNFKRDALVSTALNSARVFSPSHTSKANYYRYAVTDKLALICLDFYLYSILGHGSDDQNYQEALCFLKSYNPNLNLNDGTGLSDEHSNKVGWNGGSLFLCRNKRFAFFSVVQRRSVVKKGL